MSAAQFLLLAIARMQVRPCELSFSWRAEIGRPVDAACRPGRAGRHARAGCRRRGDPGQVSNPFQASDLDGRHDTRSSTIAAATMPTAITSDVIAHCTYFAF